MLYGDEGIPWYLKYQAKKVRPRITIEDLYGIEKIIFNKQVLDMAKEITASSSIIKKNEKDKKIEKIVGKRSNKVERKGKSRLLKVVPTKNVKLNDKDNQIKSKIHISMKSILNKEKMDRKTRGKVRANYNRSTKVTKTVKPGFSYTISSDSESIN